VLTLPLSNYVFAFTAGMLTLFSPCGLPVLPGYIAYYMGLEAPARNAVPFGFTCSLGLLTVFSLIGLLASFIGSLFSFISLLEVLAGLILILMGLFILFDVTVPVKWFPNLPKRHGFFSVFIFGVVYGMAALGCSAPIFISILFFALTSGGTLNVFTIFVTYAIGMGLPLILTTLLISMSKQLLMVKLIEASSKLHKITGAVLVMIGTYLLVYYFII
jgi:cytochrome c-type biogenesis protein